MTSYHGETAAVLMRKLRILIADDHETVREGLKTILNAQADMQVVGEATDGAGAVTQSRALQPDVVIMDVSMPGVNGLKATETLKAQCPEVKILTFTRHSDDGYLQQLLMAGASGYVLKQSRSSELVHGIRAVAAGGKYLDPAVTGKVIGDLSRRRVDLSAATSPVQPLSPREDEILRLVAWGNSHKEIAAQLQLSVKTVETHKTNAMRKLGLRSRIDIVRLALLEGWLQES